MRTILVIDYDPAWPGLFRELCARILPVVEDFALSVEHVGSTSVPGLAAKPIIDMSIVIPVEDDVPLAITRLATIGYTHRGNLGVEGREAFAHPAGLPSHHLYVSPQGSPGLRNHLALRDYLRSHPEAAREYGELKRELARRFPRDIDAYVDGKTDFILAILRDAGLPSGHLDAIERENRTVEGRPKGQDA